MKKKFYKILAIIFIAWFIIAILLILLAFHFNSTATVAIGGGLLGSWFINVILALLRGALYD